MSESDIPLEKVVNPRKEEALDEIKRKPKTKKVISIPLTGTSKKKLARIAKEQEHDGKRTTTQYLIECSNKEFNQEIDAFVPRGSWVKLCSEFWAKNKYKNQWFTIRRQCKGMPSTSTDTINWDEFVPNKLAKEVLEALKRMNIHHPYGVQAQCLHSFQSKNHLFVAAETGSGKTLAFALPLVSWIIQNQKRDKMEKAVVMVATGSLKTQVHSVFKELTLSTNVKVKMCERGDNTTEDWDILIGTPGLIEGSLKNLKDPSSVKQIVLDEADMLLDEGFTDVLTEIFSIVPVAHSETNLTPSREEGARLIFCSASCPEELECITEGVVERASLSYIKSENLHELSTNIEMKFIRLREKDKLECLAQILEADVKRGDHNQSLVFCKDRKTAKFVHESLENSKIGNSLWSSDSSGSVIEAQRVFVATDIASRGLDLPRLRHVINYDMARHTVDFLHRIGRVGRLGSKFLGSVTSFVRTPYEVEMTKKIELAARLRKPLRDIETDVTARLKERKTEDEE
ncbi:unnamed protein product [Auanema sp. JU1783]|nr:unnamed protein product [Auanema sp. JU1783]